jgi:hypothetical protein
MEMIQKYYAVHFRAELHGAAINKMRPETKKKPNRARTQNHAGAPARIEARPILLLPYHEQQRMIGHAGVAELADATDLRRT